MTAIHNLCQKGVVLKDGMMDFAGHVDDAIDHYLKSTELNIANQRLITDGIRKCKSFLKIHEIQINGTPYNTTSLSQNQEVLDVLLKGSTEVPMRCDLRMIIKSPGGTPLAGYVPGCYTGQLYNIQPGDFTIERHIRLPKYLADGDYLIDLYLHEPYRQDFFEAPDSQQMHIEGFYEPYAHTLSLSTEGFIGLESL